MARRTAGEVSARNYWHVVGSIEIDDPKDPYPFGIDRGGAPPKEGVPRPKDIAPRSFSGRSRAQDRAAARRAFKKSHEERWPFGPSNAPEAGFVVRIPIGKGPGGAQEPTELQVQISPETGRAEWIAIKCPGGLRPSEVQRLPWSNLVAVADAVSRAEREDRTRTDLRHMGGVLVATQENRRPPRPPKITRRPGRAGHPDEHYRAVADRYEELLRQGVTNPTTTIARERDYSRDTVASWVRGARDRGYLRPARPGRAG